METDDAARENVKPVAELIDSLNLGIGWIYPPSVCEPGEEKYGSTFPDEAKEMIESTDTTFFGSAGRKSTLAPGKANLCQRTPEQMDSRLS